MSKILNAIQMLDYLNTGNKYTVKELSKKIGITERMVRYYKNVPISKELKKGLQKKDRIYFIKIH